MIRWTKPQSSEIYSAREAQPRSNLKAQTRYNRTLKWTLDSKTKTLKISLKYQKEPNQRTLNLKVPI